IDGPYGLTESPYELLRSRRVAANRKGYLARDVAVRIGRTSLYSRPPVHDGRCRLIHSAVVDISSYANDLVPSTDSSDTNPLAEPRERFAPLSARHVRGDKGASAVVVNVGQCKTPTSKQQRSERPEVIGCDRFRPPQRRYTRGICFVFGCQDKI